MTQGEARRGQWKPFISGPVINIKCYPNKHKELSEIKPSGSPRDDCSISIWRLYFLLTLLTKITTEGFSFSHPLGWISLSGVWKNEILLLPRFHFLINPKYFLYTFFPGLSHFDIQYFPGFRLMEDSNIFLWRFRKELDTNIMFIFYLMSNSRDEA